MKNMKLFPKTFIHTLCLIVSMILVVFILIYSFLPTFYRQYKQREITSATKQLVSELRTTSSEQIASIVSDYALLKRYGYTASYEDGEIICSAGTGMNFEIIGSDAQTESSIQFDFYFAQSEETFQTVDGKTICLSLNVSLQPIDDAVSVLLLVLPVVLVLCLMISAVIAYFYAKSITKPIRNITLSTVQMQSLVPDTFCLVDRNDEIGILARNINEMYKKLLSTISDLEREIETVGKAEQEKLDFLLLASHELKTPVTAVRGMIEGMIYNVGIYKDRDTYLKECQKSLEGLTEMICRILETSKIDTAAAAKDRTETNIGLLLEETASPYFRIAQSRNIEMTLSIEDDFCTVVPAELIKKALSNMLSNAVKYTDSGKSIRLYMENKTVVVENECQPLSDEALAHIGEPFYHPRNSKQDAGSTGLGLYLTDRILSACELSYSFEPYENG
ncbi:MAG: HAMP domain-containing histidine kinase, partial [Lachnospiraceae bacterium]|nr:HAMP domain-containing histidine kinase [Lachnospiraceae bacterium]